jgi:hypothetical protein
MVKRANKKLIITDDQRIVLVNKFTIKKVLQIKNDIIS